MVATFCFGLTITTICRLIFSGRLQTSGASVQKEVNPSRRPLLTLALYSFAHSPGSRLAETYHLEEEANLDRRHMLVQVLSTDRWELVAKKPSLVSGARRSLVIVSPFPLLAKSSASYAVFN